LAVAAGLLLFAAGGVLLQQIIVRITDKQGNVKQIELQPGDKVEFFPKEGAQDKKPPEQARGLRPAVHPGGVGQIALSPDGKVLASCGGNEIRLWDAATLEEKAVLVGHEKTVWSIAFAPNGTLASASEDGTIRIWEKNLDKWKERGVLKAEAGAVFSVAFSADGTILASGHADKAARLWDRRSKQPNAMHVLKEHGGPIMSLALSADGKLLACRTSFGSIQLWDLSQGEPKKGALLKGGGRNRGPQVVAFAPTGPMLARCIDNYVQFWDLVDSEASKPRFTLGFGINTHGVAFSPDGNWLAVGRDRASFVVCDLQGPEPARSATLSTEGEVMSTVFGPDRKTLITGTRQGSIQLWERRGTTWEKQSGTDHR
jgi:WD40 repeat protein